MQKTQKNNMKSTLLLLLCSSVLYAQSTRKVQWSLKGGVGYYRNAASIVSPLMVYYKNVIKYE